MLFIVRLLWNSFFVGNDVSLNFCQPPMYSWRLFHNMIHDMLMSPLQNWYVFLNILDKYSSKFLLQSKHVNVSKTSLGVMYSRLDLQPLHWPFCRPSVRLLIRLDRELPINLTLWMNFILYFIIFPFSYFSISTEKVMYFSAFSTGYSNCSSNYKMAVIVWSIAEDRINFLWCFVS